MPKKKSPILSYAQNLAEIWFNNKSRLGELVVPPLPWCWKGNCNVLRYEGAHFSRTVKIVGLVTTSEVVQLCFHFSACVKPSFDVLHVWISNSYQSPTRSYRCIWSSDVQDEGVQLGSWEHLTHSLVFRISRSPVLNAEVSSILRSVAQVYLI